MKGIVKSISIMYKISKSYIALTIVSSLLNSVAQISLVYSIKIVIDNLQIGSINILYTLMTCIFLLSILLPFTNSILSNRTTPILNNLIEKKLTELVYKKYISIDLNILNNTDNYNNYYYTLENIHILKNIFEMLSTMLTSFISTIGMIGLFIIYDKKIVISIIIGALLSFILSLVKENLEFKLEIDNLNHVRRLNYINKVFYHPEYSKEIRNNYTDIFFNDYTHSYNSLNKNIEKASKKIIPLNFFMGMIKINVFLFVIFILCNKVIDKEITIGSFSMIISGCQEMYSNLESLFMHFPSLYSISLKLKKIQQFFSLDCKKDCLFDVKKIEKISLIDISFEYSKDIPILKNINMLVEENDKIVVIIGENGSGKSTLLNIISGIYKPSSGQILYNDKLVVDYDLSNIREHFYTIYQDFKFFPISLKENFKLKIKNSNSYSNDELEKVINESLKLVGLYSKVSKLKNGINTIITKEFDDSGDGFSHGEFQRLALAKAYLSDSEILILDEPFSFSDISLKNDIPNILKVLSKDKKIFIITHELKNISNYDKVYIIRNNKLERYDKENDQ